MAKYNPQKIVNDSLKAMRTPKPVANMYYPTYRGADGQVHQSPTPAPMPKWSPEPSRGQKKGM
jgi:hypothetical protein